MRFWLLLVVPIIFLTVLHPRIAYVFGDRQFRSQPPDSLSPDEHYRQPAWLREDDDDDGLVSPEEHQPDRRFHFHR